MKTYDTLLYHLDIKIRPIILNETRDMMSIITSYNKMPLFSHVEFSATLLSIYLLHVAGVKLNTETLAPYLDEVKIMLEAVDQLREKIMSSSDDHQLLSYADKLKNQGQKFEA